MTTMTSIKTYSKLIEIPTFIERYRYLKLDGSVGIETFGFDRYLNQALYKSHEWKRVRDQVIIRDNGCDLGIDDRTIYGTIIIHHMNPITERDIHDRNPIIFDPDFLITVSLNTHNAIHYGDESLVLNEIVERKPNDTILWR